MRRYHFVQVAGLLAAASLWSATAFADLLISWTGQPVNHDLRMQPATITGFDSIRFGMSLQQVEQILVDTWPDARPRRGTDPVQRTTLLTVNLQNLAPVQGIPAPGSATVTYLFGYRSGTLMTVNLNWYAEGEATDEQRSALLDAGSAYVAQMLSYYWEPLQSARGHVTGANALLMFAGRDTHGRGVEVQVEGVALDILLPDGSTQHRPARGGPAQLHIGLSAAPDAPDIFHLPQNSF